jgi:hypothetical protein
MKNENIERKIEETLNSLENIQRAEANSYLFTRIEQRFKNHEQVANGNTFYRLAFALILFIIMNVFTYTKFQSNGVNQGGTKSGIETFATEYGLQQTGVNI